MLLFSSRRRLGVAVFVNDRRHHLKECLHKIARSKRDTPIVTYCFTTVFNSIIVIPSHEDRPPITYETLRDIATMVAGVNFARGTRTMDGTNRFFRCDGPWHLGTAETHAMSEGK